MGVLPHILPRPTLPLPKIRNTEIPRMFFKIDPGSLVISQNITLTKQRHNITLNNYINRINLKLRTIQSASNTQRIPLRFISIII